MAKRSDPKTIGLFVAGALALGVATVVILASGHFFRRTHEYVVFFRGNVNGLRVGAPVKFKGVEIGAVKDVRLNLKFQAGATRKAALTEITIPVLIDIDQGKLARYGTGTFDLSDPTGIRIAVASGMRAQLAMQSLLTGLLYVDLEMYPNTKPNLVLKANSSIQEIPTIPTALEEAQSAATRVVSALDRVDFPRVFSAISDTLDSIRDIVQAPETKETFANLNRTLVAMNETALSIRETSERMNGQIEPTARELRETSESANLALKHMQGALDALQASLGPKAPLIYQSGQTLQQLSDAARSLRELTDYLQRNPSAIVRGRAAHPVEQ